MYLIAFSFSIAVQSDKSVKTLIKTILEFISHIEDFLRNLNSEDFNDLLSKQKELLRLQPQTMRDQAAEWMKTLEKERSSPNFSRKADFVELLPEITVDDVVDFFKTVEFRIWRYFFIL